MSYVVRRLLPLFVAGLVPSIAGASGPISITSNSDFASCGCVSGGNGSTSKPYIIGPLTISGASGNGIYIDGSNLTASFNLSNVTVKQSGGYGIVLNHINPSGSQTIVAEVTGVQTSINNNNVGVLVENSSYVTLDGNGEATSGWGIGNSGAGTINTNFSGAIDIENSSHITVKGWQASANGQSLVPDYVTLDPSTDKWDVGGVRLFGSNYCTIDHNAFNNDTNPSISVFNSNHNTVSNNTADYPFVTNLIISDGSAYNTVTGNEFSTADFIGMMVADPLPGSWTLNQYGPTHDNVVSGNTIHTDGPTGNELNPVSIAPAFLGGIVILNGTYNNKIENNQTWGSFGTDLAWAQAVPANTPIGVATYTPTIHCNVTDSEGGGGVINLNGNVWSGNTYKTIDSCIPAQ